MRLLFDENLSPRLVEVLAAEFPDSGHVGRVGLQGADDRLIWLHARAAGLAIVSKDTDFRDRSVREGSPPKVVWLDVGNAGTGVIAKLLARERSAVEAFDATRGESLLVLSLGGPAP